MLYPYELPQKPSSGTMPVAYHIPVNNQWLVLDDNTGNETFYLIATSRRLSGLESLLSEYNTAGALEKDDLGRKVIKKLKVFNQQSKKMTAVAERPVQVGGTVRSSTSKGEKMLLKECNSVMVSAKDFYIKAITIEHK